MAQRTAKKKASRQRSRSTTSASLPEVESPTPTSFEVAAGRAEAVAEHEAELARDAERVNRAAARPSVLESSRNADETYDDPTIEILPPSSRGAIVLDTVPPPPSLARLPIAMPANKNGLVRWLGIVATFVAVAVMVGGREDIGRALRRMRVPTPAGLFRSLTGASAAAGQVGEPDGPCPVEMSLVESADGSVRVCVDRFEGSLVEISEDGKEHAFSPYLSPVTGGTPEERHQVKAVSKPNAVPQAYISRDDAEQACTQAGKRLCRAEEWKTACGGPGATSYPYGNVEDTTACNTTGKAPLGELFPLYGEEIYDFRVMNDPSLNALPGTVAPTASYPRCANAYGLYDMVGNLHEWTAEKGGEFHGGYYLDTHENGDGCGYVTSAHDATYHDYSTGFRCCMDAPNQ